MSIRTIAVCALLLSLFGTQTSLAKEQTVIKAPMSPLSLTQNGSVPIKLFDGAMNSANLQIYDRVNGYVIFSAPQNSNDPFDLWSSTGKPGITATRLYKGMVQNAIRLNQNLLFFAAAAGNDSGLWKTDGTLTHTQQISSNLQQFSSPVVLSDSVLFGNNGVLWRTDGTVTGTQPITSFTFPSGSFQPFIWKGNAYFFANDGISGAELWKSNGTVTGTVLVKEMYPGSEGADFALVAQDTGNELLFVIFKNSVWSLWATDGTTGGGRLVKNLTAPPVTFTKSGDIAYFLAQRISNNGVDGVLDLWQTDGTFTGTVTVSVGSNALPFFGVPYNLGEDQTKFFASINNGALLFRGRYSADGAELWKTSGTVTSTQVVTDINTGGNNSSPLLISAGNRAFFGANDGIHGRELWASDGTITGTTLVSELVPGITSSLFSNIKMKYIDGLLLFSAYDEQEREQLWMLQAAPSIVSGPPSAAEQDRPYTHTFTTEGWPTSTFQITSGSLPPGIQLLPTGVLTGTPTASGNYTATLSASNGSLPDATQSFVIQVLARTTPTPTPTSTPQPLPAIKGVLRSPNNAVIPNAVVELYTNTLQVGNAIEAVRGLVISTTTDSGGRFAFQGIGAGTYQLAFKLPPSLGLVLPSQTITFTGDLSNPVVVDVVARLAPRSYLPLAIR